MKPGIIITLAVVLAIAGGICWTLGRSDRDTAHTSEQLATMRFQEAADHGTSGARSMVGMFSQEKEASESRATADYWLGKYDSVSAQRSSTGEAVERTPSELMIAANASYRTAMAATSPSQRPAGLQQLENAIKNYAEAMKADPNSEDAAFNYELAIRTRETIAKLPANNPAPKPPPPGAIHGVSGAPPKGSGMSEFKVIVPQQPDERKEDQKAGQGEKRTKKG